ncbi:acyl-CoA dehydrogenase family protein [Mesorhizobium comanense]|uniref:acyl-CoA dehydrogenase family protein n=1 Tax=Mesorhizobium comanense TaxID=2502215 RepID=UPI0010FA439E|nr:acyl-CoA dehydrogenase family protein [Mesorhizobium comanense]
MNFDLSPREKELSKKGRDFCDQVLLPLEMITDEHGELPMERREAVRQQVRDWGLAGINHSKENGGLGLTMVEQTAIEEQLGRVTNGLWSCVWRPPVSLKFGTEAQKRDYLVPSSHGYRRGAFAITEPEAGSDPRRVKTGAVLKNGEWHLTGEKWFVTSYNASDFVIVHAHVDDDPDKPTLFLVDKPVNNMVHLRSPKFMHNFAFDHAELRFEGTTVGEDKMLGRIGQGLELTKDWFVEARLQIASHAVGAATRAAEIANDYATTRHQFDRPIRDFQGVEFMLADMAIDIFAAKSMLYRVAWEIDQGLDRKRVHAHASALKLYCSEAAGRVIDKALQVLGGRGYMRENPVERLYRDIRVDRIWEGTSEIQRVVVAGQIRKRGMGVFSEVAWA